jgi:hypothetical protein
MELGVPELQRNRVDPPTILKGRGLVAIRGNEWVAGIAQGLNVVRAAVADVRVEHEVRSKDLTTWLDRRGGSPREIIDRQRSGRFLDCGSIVCPGIDLVLTN